MQQSAPTGFTLVSQNCTIEGEGYCDWQHPTSALPELEDYEETEDVTQGNAGWTYQAAKSKPATIELFLAGSDEIRWEKIKYWSNSMGELHRYGNEDINEEELPEILRKAYDDVFSLGSHKTYLVETSDGYGMPCSVSLARTGSSVYSQLNQRISMNTSIRMGLT